MDGLAKTYPVLLGFSKKSFVPARDFFKLTGIFRYGKPEILEKQTYWRS